MTPVIELAPIDGYDGMYFLGMLILLLTISHSARFGIIDAADFGTRNATEKRMASAVIGVEARFRIGFTAATDPQLLLTWAG
jgi:hypothetical protein